MYPIVILWNIQIYVFGIFILITWITFFFFLDLFGQKKGIVKSVFSDIFSFTLSMFLFGRLFDMLSNWRDTKFLFQDFFSGTAGISNFFHHFFLPENYNLSLAWGIIGFVLIFVYKTRNQENQRKKYLDIILPSFVIAAIIWYIGAFLGGQVYGTPSSLPIAIEYNTKYAIVPFRGAVFPLAPMYILGLFILLWIFLRLEKRPSLPDGYIGYILMALFGVLLFFGEFFSGSSDMFEIFIRINQFVAIVFFVIGSIWIIKFLRS